MSNELKTNEEAGIMERVESVPEVQLEPFADVFQDDHGIRVMVDMPGVREDGLDVDVRDGVLRISGRAARSPEETRLYERAFRLGRRVDSRQIIAALRQGVLELTLPYHEEAKLRKITVSVSE